MANQDEGTEESASAQKGHGLKNKLIIAASVLLAVFLGGGALLVPEYLEKAEEEREKARVETLLAEADACFSAGDYGGAADLYISLAETAGVQASLKQTALALADEGNMDKASEVASFVAGEEGETLANYLAGLKAVESGDLGAALELLAGATSLEGVSEKYVRLSMAYALQLLQDDDYDGAREWWQKAADETSDNETKYLCLFLIADSLMAQGRMEEARQQYELLPASYSNGESTVVERLGQIALVGEWTLESYYSSEEGVTYTREDGEVDDDLWSLIFSPDGRWYCPAISGAYGSGVGTWEIVTDYDGPDDFAIVFDKGTSVESPGFVTDGRLFEHLSNGNTVITYTKVED